MAEASSNGKKILIAEDDLFLSNAYSVKLKSLGYAVTVVKSGEEALKELKENKPDLLLLDLVMPGKGGFDVLKEMQEDESINVPVFVLSNLAEDQDMEKAKSLGAADYHVKSDTPIHDLVAKIQELLD